MEKKTIDTLRVMLCGEIEDIAKKGTLSHETLDILKDLVETEKNLSKIEKYDAEKEEKEEMKKMGMGMDMGYSQRKYYIDADYQPGTNSYARGGRGSYDMGGNSMMRGGNSRMDGNYGMYGMGGSYADGGNPYMFYDPRYDASMYSMAGGRGYSRTGSKEETISELQKMMGEVTDDKVKMALQEAISKMNK